MTVDVSGNVVDAIYDGASHSVSGATYSSSAKYFESSYVNYSGGTISTSATDAGTYTYTIDVAKLGYSDSDNVDVTFNKLNDTTLNIAKANALITASEGFKYDGEAKTVSGIIATGTVGAEQISANLTTNSGVANVFTQAGTTDATFTPALTYESGAKAENYNIIYNVVISITNSEDTITIVGNNDTVTFDGQQHSVTGYTATATFDGFDESKIHLQTGISAYVVGINAGTYQMGLSSDYFTYDGNSSVTFKVIDGTLTINKKALTRDMVTMNTTDFTYSGNTITPDVVYKDNNGSLTNDDFEVTGASGTNSGTYSITVTATNSGNYTGSITGIN